MTIAFAITHFLAAAAEPRWWDYPGFELWKFINLGIFVLALVYVLTKKVKLGEAFKSRRENIKSELARARQERDAAMAKLKEVEERLARLDSEVATIKEQSKHEAEQERERIARSTETDIRSEEHTSELQSLAYLVCRLLLEKKKRETGSDPSAASAGARRGGDPATPHHPR